MSIKIYFKLSKAHCSKNQPSFVFQNFSCSCFCSVFYHLINILFKNIKGIVSHKLFALFFQQKQSGLLKMLSAPQKFSKKTKKPLKISGHLEMFIQLFKLEYQSMKFGKNLRGDSVPQWRQCYLDYEHLKIFVSIIKRIVELIEMAESILGSNQGNDNQEQTQIIINDRILNENTDHTQLILNELQTLLDDANRMFFEARWKGMDINRTFIQMKLLEISNNFEKCKILKTMPIEAKEKELIVNLMEFIYVQCSYLEAMKDLNLQGQRKILKKHKKYANDKTITPYVKNRRYRRLGKCLSKLLVEIEDMYAKFAEGASKQNRDALRKLSQKIQSTGSDSFIFGAWVGIIATVIIILIVILAVNKKSIQTDPVFNRDFPTWRGIAFFIFYIWILGFNTNMFQKYGVSHRIIMNFNQHHYSTSTDIFIVAGFFSTFWLVMFAIYVIQITHIGSLDRLGYQYLVLFVWGLFFVYLINPLPIFNWRSRLYALKLALISIISPFRGVTFPVIWMTDQVISLVTPLKDFGYTLCYYQHIDLSEKIVVSSNYCNSATRIEIVFAVGAVAYSYRILQCLRQGYDKGAYLFKPEFFNTIKYASSLLTLLLSYIYKAGDPQIFGLWLFFTIFTTFYSYVWDLKMDWALLEPDAPKRFLRRNLTFLPARNYYLIMVGNLFLRLAWVTTLSPAIVDNAFGSPQIFSLVTGALEIFRRGLWNLLRVQKQHLQNCKNFQAVPDISEELEQSIIEKLREKTKKSGQPFSVLFTSSIIFLSNHIRIQKISQKNQIQKDHFLQVIRQSLNTEENEKKSRKKKVKEMKKRTNHLYSELKSIYSKMNIKMPKINEYDDD